MSIRAVPSSMRQKLNGADLPIVNPRIPAPRRKPAPWDVRAIATSVRIVSSVPAPAIGLVAYGVAWWLTIIPASGIWFPVCVAAFATWAISLARWSGKWYPKARAFVVAHLGGMITAPARYERLAKCAECPWLARKNGRMYCGRCDCGTHPAARLSWKSWLRWAECPANRWKAE